MEPPPRESVRDVSLDTPFALPPVFTGSPQAFANPQVSTFVRPENRGLRVVDPNARGGSSVATLRGRGDRRGRRRRAPRAASLRLTEGDDAGRFPRDRGRIFRRERRGNCVLGAARPLRLRACAGRAGSAPAGTANRPSVRAASARSHATFDQTGAVTDVALDPPYAGTSRGGCIAGLFRTARGPLYKGPPHDTPHKFFVP